MLISPSIVVCSCLSSAVCSCLSQQHQLLMTPLLLRLLGPRLFTHSNKSVIVTQPTVVILRNILSVLSKTLSNATPRQALGNTRRITLSYDSKNPSCPLACQPSYALACLSTCLPIHSSIRSWVDGPQD